MHKVLIGLRNGMLLIVLSIAITAGLYLLVNWLGGLLSPKPDGSWITSIASLETVDSRNSKIEYYVNGIYQRQNVGSGFDSKVIGEKWRVLVDTDHPVHYIVKTWEPVFLPDERTDTVMGMVYKVDRGHWGSADEYTPVFGLTYSYRVNGASYSRTQALPPGVKDANARYRKGQQWPVCYLRENPERSVILIR